MKKQAMKTHMILGTIFSIPIILTALTGMGYAFFDEILGKEEIGEFLLKIHTMEIFGLEKIYPFIVGISLIGLICTGLYVRFKKPAHK